MLSRKYNLIISVIMFVFICGFSSLHGGWQYRKEITINSTGTALTDYQVLVTLTPANFNYANSDGSDGHDMWFSTDSTGFTGQDIYYWIEEWAEDDTSKIWIKIPSIPASGNKVVYLFYGNASATAASNGDSTFIFFDDFNDGIINSPWIELESIGSIVESNGVLETIECGQYGGQYCTDGYAYVYLDISTVGVTLSNPFKIMIKTWNNEDGYTSGGEVVQTALWKSIPHRNWPLDAVFFRHGDTSNHTGEFYKGYDGSVFLTNYELFQDKWFWEEFRFDGTNLELWFDDSVRDTISTWSATNAYLQLGNTRNGDNIDNNKWDDLVIAKSASQEPTISVNTSDTNGSWSLLNIPSAPTYLTAIPGNSQVTLTWTANTESDLASYNIYGDTSSIPITLLSTIPAGTETYTHIDLANGTTYYYRISAVDNSGNESNESEVVSAKPLKIKPFHFVQVPPTGLPYNIVIDSVSFTGFEFSLGDTLGIFDDTLCVGLVSVTQSLTDGEELNIVAWEGDTDYGLLGFTSGHSIRIAILSHYFGEREVLDPIPNYIIGDGTFGSGSYSSVNIGMAIDDIPLFEANNTNVSFGAVPIYENTAEVLIITNRGSRNLIIKDIISDRSEFSTEFSNEMIINPDNSMEIQLYFTPSTEGSYTGELSIVYNNPENSPQHVGLTGVATQTVKPEMTGYSNTMYLGEMAHGDTIKADWFVQNTGNDTLDVWDIYSNDYHFSVGLNTFSLEPGGLISIPVEFVPDGKGLYSTTMYFSHNAPNVTQNWIDLYGIGYDGYFKTVQPTGLPYTIIIDSIMVDHLELNYGEEIGVFADSLCVGVGVKGLLEKIQMVAWQKDEGFNLPGFSIDDSISYKFWGYRYDDNREVDLISTYDAGNGLFGYEPLSVVSLSGSTGLFSSIKTSDDKIVFGTSPINNDKSQEIVISNEGNATLNIHDIRFSSGVFFTNQSAFSISPDSSKLLQVFFQPIEAEYYTESMTIHYNDPVNSPLKINLEGLGLPLHQSQLKLPSPNLTFDPTIVGGSLTLDLYIINDGNSPLSINSIVSTSPDFNVDFSPVNINPGSLANFPITFIPSSKGMSTAKFQITSDNAGNGSNHYVYARGVGYDGFFQPVPPTGLPYHIIIDSLATFYDSHLDIGDEVGVFDNDFCVGVGVVKDNILNDKPGAIVVDGNHDFIDCGVPELMFNSTSGTMEAWVNPSLLNSDHWFFSYSMDDENAFAACIQSNGVLGYQMNSGGVHGTSNQTAQIDQWTHVAISWNNSEIKLFVNGILDNTINQSGHPTYSEDHLYIGIDSFDRNQYSFSGSIDEVRLWNIERSESQIQDNMNSIISTNSNNLIGYWRIENDEISIVEDLTGNGYNGTIFGDVQITQDIPPITSSLGGFAQLQITAWEKDETYGLPGFTLGDSMLFLVRSNFNNDSDTIPEIHLADPVYRSGDGYFGTGKLSVSQLYVTDKKYSKNIGLSKTSLDIGQVQIDSVSTEMITINNYGNFPLSVFNIKNSNPSFTLSDSSFVLSPNDSIMLKISFHATRIKTEHDTIAIKNNDLDEEDQLKFIYLSATGIDTIGPHSPADINAVPFSKVVILNWISSVDKDIYKYLVHRGIESVSDSVIAEVYYPDTTFTDYDAIHDVEYYYYLTPVDTLNNKGKSSSVVSAIPHLRHIVVSDDILNFGSIQVDSIDTLPFTIWSKGNQPLNILDMDISDEFAISDTSVSLSAVDSITLTITLKPNRPKIIIDTLYIYNDDVDLEDQVKKVVLTGLGIDTIPPILPMNVVSNTAPKQITITWSSNIEPDLEKYLIHRGIDAPDDAIIAEVFSPDTIFIDTDIYRDIIYYYYVTAMDTVGNISAPSDTIMALAVNSPPEMTSLIDLSQESHGNIQLQFLVEDVENDSINYGFYFSTDRLNWSIPTLTDILENNSSSIIDTLNFTWISEEDLGETDLHDVYLKIEAFDQFDTSIFVSDPMNIDNFVGTVIINPDQELDEYSNQIQFPYVIIDTTYDHYDLSLSFSIDSGFTWNGFEIWTIADSTMYFDTIKWNSQQDLLNFDGEVQVAFGLNDGWQYGVGDTLSLNLDNQFLPNIVNVELANYCFDPVRFTFNKEIDFASLLDGLLLSSRHGIYEGYQLDYDMSSYMVTIKNATGWLAGDSLDIELTPNVTDIYGNPFDGNGNDDPDSTGDSTHYTIPINLLGDFDNSGGVNFADLLSFQQFWLSDSLTITDEVGPTIGIPPYFQFLPDNKFDFEDLMVFIQMWNWTAGFDYGGGENLAKTVHSNHERLTLNTDYTHSESGQKQLKITLNVQDFINVGAMEFKIQYDTSDVKFIHLSSSIDNSWVILSHNDERNGRITINIADLEKNVRSITGSPLTISFIGLKEIESGLIWQADIRNRKGGTKEIVSGTYKFNTFAPVPEEYALHQNFPNPFNPTTNIQYDLPEETQVFLVIYNLLGQEVTQLVNKTQTAGFYSVIWNSKNRYGKLVSPGIYFYLLKTDNYSSVRKLVLLK